jgi:hypothetical protein
MSNRARTRKNLSQSQQCLHGRGVVGRCAVVVSAMPGTAVKLVVLGTAVPGVILGRGVVKRGATVVPIALNTAKMPAVLGAAVLGVLIAMVPPGSHHGTDGEQQEQASGKGNIDWRNGARGGETHTRLG